MDPRDYSKATDPWVLANLLVLLLRGANSTTAGLTTAQTMFALSLAFPVAAVVATNVGVGGAIGGASGGGAAPT